MFLFQLLLYICYINFKTQTTMKKVFLMLAFAGLVGSVSASVKSTGDDDKDKKATKKSCCKEKAGAEGKSCSGEKTTTTSGDKTTTIEKKTCCKSKTTIEAKPTEAK